jgi:alpha-glucosidase
MFRILTLLVLISPSSHAQKQAVVYSPSGKIQLLIESSDTLRFSVSLNNRRVSGPNTLAMLVKNKKTLGVGVSWIKQSSASFKDTIINPVPFKRRIIPNQFHELTLQFRDGYSLQFRAYDDGIAYRFKTNFQDSIIIENEFSRFQFSNDNVCYFPEIQRSSDHDIFHTSSEEPYRELPLRTISSDQVAYSPILIALPHAKLLLTESDLMDYPGMFFRGTGTSALKGIHAPYPEKEEIRGSEFKQMVVTSRKKILAKTLGKRSFPWRVIALAEKDADLVMSDLVYRLGAAPDKQDWSWVRPGLSTEEWITGINLYNVPFKAGINTATYKYYIDFAERFHLEYVMLDAGWSANDDLFKITPGLDLEEIARYAKQKSVGLILWTQAMTLDQQLEKAVIEFNRLGIKILMTDFIDRDDQKANLFYHRVANACADHHLMVMFHGTFKNAGFERTYPNAITREAVLGSEYNIWSAKANPDHDLMLPFIRMAAGPMDYEPGLMENVSKDVFTPQWERVESQGTRCHQLAMFVVYESPLQLFSGNISDAWKEPEYMEYLSSLPTTWDETVVIEAKLGDYVLVARRKDNDWYIGGMTDWTVREFTIDLNFLSSGKYKISTCPDGINASKNPRDYQFIESVTEKNQKLTIQMSSGGGFVAKLIKL